MRSGRSPRLETRTTVGRVTDPQPKRRRRGIAGFSPEPGPFDEPPAEPIELDPDALPWELRDAGPEPELDSDAQREAEA